MMRRRSNWQRPDSWWRSPLPVLSALVTAEFVLAGVLVRMILETCS